MSYSFAAIKALKALNGQSEVRLSLDGQDFLVRTDTDSLRPEIVDLGPCSCNVLLWSLCNSEKAQCICKGSFARALGPVGPKIHLILMYGIQKGPTWTPRAHESHSALGLSSLGAQKVLFAGRHKTLKINFKSQQFLSMGHKDPEIIRNDFKKQLK
jgi:hypothetical protein